MEIDREPVARIQDVVGFTRRDVNFARSEHELIWDGGRAARSVKKMPTLDLDGFRFPGRLHVNLKDETGALRQTPTHAFGDEGRDLSLAAN